MSVSSSLRVAVIAGGPSGEAAVSRVSSAAVRRALASAGHQAQVLELDDTLAGELRTGRFDVVFPATHGPLGEDGCLQGMLEVLGLPYVGSGVLASALAMSKPHAKVAFRAAGLPVAADATVVQGDDLEAAAARVRSEVGAALIVKPASGGSAIGVGRIAPEDPDAALAQALRAALEVDSLVLVESFRPGLEVTCGVIDQADGSPRALPPTQILPRAAEWYDFESRYAAGGSEHLCPAPFEPGLLAWIQEVAARAHLALGARDLSRADFVVDPARGREGVTLLEVNTLPGMTPTSLYPEAAAAAGIPFVDLCDRLVRGAHRRPPRHVPRTVPFPGAPPPPDGAPSSGSG